MTTPLITRIATYNVNGIRAALKKDLLEWMDLSDIDIICLQEIKADIEQVPQFYFHEKGYNCYWYSAEKKGYSGVAIISKRVPDHVEYGMGIPEYDREGRLIRADFGDVSVVSVYHPSGSSGDNRQGFKMKWLDDFYNYVEELKKTRPNLIICGDFNICHKPIDIHDPIRNATSSGFLPEERIWMSKYFDSDFIDSFRHVNDKPNQYTWWSYRANARYKNLGWRIDYICHTSSIHSCFHDSKIDANAIHSDHCPVISEYKLEFK